MTKENKVEKIKEEVFLEWCKKYLDDENGRWFKRIKNSEVLVEWHISEFVNLAIQKTIEEIMEEIKKFKEELMKDDNYNRHIISEDFDEFILKIKKKFGVEEVE